MVAARYGHTRAKRGQIERTNDATVARYDDTRGKMRIDREDERYGFGSVRLHQGKMRIDREDERHGLAWYSEIRGKMRTGGDSG